MAINYADLYAKALSQPFKVGLKSHALFVQGADYKDIDAQTIKIPTLSMDGYRNHGRGKAIQTPDDFTNTYVAKTLTHDRSKSILVDPMDIEETNMARSVANFTDTFVKEHKIPELDAYTFSKLYKEFTDASGTVIEEDLTAENVLGVFDDIMLAMDNAEVPSEGRILFVTPGVNKLLKQADGLTRFIGAKEGEINRSVYNLDDVEIVTVPAGRFKTEYDFEPKDLQGNTIGGFVADEDAETIQMLLVHPKAQVSTVKLDQALLDEPKASSSGKYHWFERSYGDTFLLPNKIDGVQFVLPGTKLYDISFTINDSSGAVKDADVKVGKEVKKTDAEGKVTFKKKPGDWTYRVSKTGYVTQYGSIVVTDKDVVVSAITLAE